MARYTVLYHDPVRLSAEQRERYDAGHSVWVCRDDRYAFEVVAFAVRSDDELREQWGEARFRLALALFAAGVARQAAAAAPRRSDVVCAECSRDELVRRIGEIEAARRVNFGAVIAAFDQEADDAVLALR